MKKLLTFLFVLGGLAFAQTAFAQTPTGGSKDKKAKKVESDSTNSTQKSSGTVAPPPAPGGGADEITIDESGAPRPKSKKKSAASTGSGAPEPTPKIEAEEAAQKAQELEQSAKKGVEESAKKEAIRILDDMDAPSEIAIDEAGASRPAKPKPASTDVTNPPSLDSTIIGPIFDIMRPK